MSKGGDHKTYTRQWFLAKGYTENKDGSWSPPKYNGPFSSVQKFTNNPLYDDIGIIPKQKINNSPDFKVKPVIEWFIPYQLPSKKNARQNFIKNGKQISIPSKRYAEYVKVTKKYWQIFGKEFRKSVEELKLSYPLNVEFTFVRSTNQVVDYFGPGESAADLMVDNDWIPDDSSRYLKPFFGDIEVDKNKPGTRIKLIV